MWVEKRRQHQNTERSNQPRSYTFIIEYFLPEMTNVSVTVESTTAYVNKQSSKGYKNDIKHLVQFSRWNSSPPQYLEIDLHGHSSSNNPVGRMIVYGVKENVNKVDPSVYDKVLVIENQKMVMETDTDMNNHKINVPQFITGYYNKSKHHNRIFLNGVNPLQIVPYNCRLNEISCYFYENQSSDFQINLKVRSDGQASMKNHLTQHKMKGSKILQLTLNYLKIN